MTPIRILVLLVVATVLIQSTRATSANQLKSETLEAIREAGELVESDPETAIDRLLKQERSVEAGSPDDAYLKLSRIQILLSNERTAEAIEPFKRVISYQTLDAKTQERTVRGLGHVYYQLDRREDLIQLFESHFPNPDLLQPDTLQLYAVATLDSDQASKSVDLCQIALGKKNKLDRNLCQIAAAALQREERHSESARFIELMLEDRPDEKTLWEQLAAAYFRAGDLWAAFGAIDRAQEREFMQATKDRATKIEILYQLERYAAAAQGIESWIAENPQSVEKRIWDLLLYCYEQQNLDTRKIETLKRASELTNWPDFDLQLADHFWQSQKYAAVYDSILRAFSKGTVDNPSDAWTLATAAAISLERLDRAEFAIENARDTNADIRQLERLGQAIEKLRIKTADPAVPQSPKSHSSPTRS